MTIPKRQLIREAAKALLIDNTNAGSNVYSNRVSAFWKSEFPCISIFMHDESSAPRNMGGRQSIRTGTLVVQVVDEATENLDDSLDLIADEVESVFESNLSLSGTVQSCVLQNTEMELSSESAKPVGSVTLTYQITYLKN